MDEDELKREVEQARKEAFDKDLKRYSTVDEWWKDFNKDDNKKSNTKNV